MTHEERLRRDREKYRRRMVKDRERIKRRAKYLRRRKYGISQEVYEEMVSAQGGRCAICRRKPELLHVDHDHTTGVVRGLLCGPCNVGLGMFKDNPAYLQRAVRYLLEA